MDKELSPDDPPTEADSAGGVRSPVAEPAYNDLLAGGIPLRPYADLESNFLPELDPFGEGRLIIEAEAGERDDQFDCPARIAEVRI